MKFKTILSGWILGLFALSGTSLAEAPKESGEKSGTQDINIGVGELQEDPQNAKREIAREERKKKAAKKEAEKKAARKIKRKKKPDAVATEKEIARKDAADSATKKKKSGNVEATWKVEEGAK